MRLAAVATVLALLGACSSFDTDAPVPSGSNLGDGGGGSTTGGSSSSSSGGDAGEDPSCPGGLPLEAFTTTEFPSGWVQQGAGSTGSIEITSASYFGAQGNYLHAKISNTNIVDDPPALLSAPIGVTKRVRLEYDLAIKTAEHYSEIGCQIELWGPTVNQDLVVLFVGVAHSGASLITGWDYKHAGAPLEADDSPLLAGWQPSKWQHLVMDATLDGSQVAVQVSLDGGPPTLVTPPTAAYSFREVHVRCGLLYLMPEPDGVQQSMDVGIDNIKVSTCASP